MLKKNWGGFAIIAFVVLIALGLLMNASKPGTVSVSKMDGMMDGTWQAEVKFPDWKGFGQSSDFEW